MTAADTDLSAEIDATISLFSTQEDNLILILHAIQDAHGYVQRESALILSERLAIPLARIYEVLTFYHYFRTSPPGEHTVVVCHGTSCWLAGSSKVLEQARQYAESHQQIKVEQVRGLSEFLSVGGHRGGSRLVLIDPADTLNVVSANALLKTLEEPQSTVRFVLVTGRASVLPVTIRSRCQTVTVRSPSAEQALAWLVAQSGAETAQARQWLAAAGWAPLHALAFARDEFATAYRLVVETLARLPDSSIVNAADSLASLQAGQWLPVLQSWVHDLGRLMVGHQPIRHLPQVSRLRELGLRTMLSRLTQLSVWLDQQAQLTDHPMNARLFCESTLLRYTGIFGQGTK